MKQSRNDSVSQSLGKLVSQATDHSRAWPLYANRNHATIFPHKTTTNFLVEGKGGDVWTSVGFCVFG